MYLKRFKEPQWIIGFFLIILVWIAALLDMSLTTLFNESLIKLAMNGVLVLSLLPMLNGGMGLNFGLSVGITSGLVGMCIGINMRLSGLVGFLGCVIFAIAVACIIGTVYGKLIIQLKGREEIGSTFIGFIFYSYYELFLDTCSFF